MTYSVVILTWDAIQEGIYPDDTFNYFSKENKKYIISDHISHTSVAMDFMETLSSLTPLFDERIIEYTCQRLTDVKELGQLCLSYLLDLSLVKCWQGEYRAMTVMTLEELLEESEFTLWYNQMPGVLDRGHWITPNPEDDSIVWFELAKYFHFNPNKQYCFISFS